MCILKIKTIYKYYDKINNNCIFVPQNFIYETLLFAYFI